MSKIDGAIFRQGMVKGENEKNEEQLLQKIIEAKGEARGTILLRRVAVWDSTRSIGIGDDRFVH